MGSKARARASRLSKLVGTWSNAIYIDELHNDEAFRELQRRLATAGDQHYPQYLAQQDIREELQE